MRHSWLNEFKSRYRRSMRSFEPSRPHQRKVILQVELLEDRSVPALFSGPPAFDAVSGQLLLVGDDGDNTAQVAMSAGGFLTVQLDGQLYSSDASSANYCAGLAGVSSGTLREVRFDAGAGQDALLVNELSLAGSLAIVGDESVTIAGPISAHAGLSIAASSAIDVQTGAEVAARSINLAARVVTIGGSLTATGGGIEVNATNVLHFGTMTSGAPDGGMIDVHFTGSYLETTAARTIVTGTDGGTIRVHGDAGSTLYASGQHVVTGQTGGQVDLLASRINLMAATVDVSGGGIRIGGDFQGQNPNILNADSTTIGVGTALRADGLANGNGGRVIVWSEAQTRFLGDISARGGALGGDGGFIEVSSKGDLAFAGLADAGASHGSAGTLLLDPKNLIIDTAGILPYFELIDPTPNVGDQFGLSVVPLSTGNVEVSDPFDDFGGTDGGAVHLFNGLTGALISSVYGSANCKVGSDGGKAVGDGNFLILSPFWDNGSATDAGAVTWGNGTTGISGVVSAANSLVGSTSNDLVGGFAPIKVLRNGNYVVRSSKWDNGTVVDAGAATWANGATGITGVISAANSLVGSTNNDAVSAHGIVELSNGNYVVRSLSWDNGVAANAGAVTWVDGTTGITGVVSAANSLVGSKFNDQIGSGDFQLLSNGNYVITSPAWDNGLATDAGAVTLGDATTGVSGVVSAANSLVGSDTNDQVGFSGITTLSNGNYVVKSELWGVANVGAVTWCSGTTGTSGVVSAANSLVGSQSADRIGTVVIALSNGNYVVDSDEWDNGAITNVGAVTWGDGANGTVGLVSPANSLVGSTSEDRVGFGGGVIALSNGNYVVRSKLWNNGAATAAGAVTWCNGTTGMTGVVSAANSLVGSATDDQVGSGNNSAVIALSNGNYVVRTHTWDNGSIIDAGAVTWGDGTTGISGVISAANSLVGSSNNDQVGWATWDGFDDGIRALGNGNYIVRSQFWDSGTTADVGAVTWGNGATGTVGVVSAANSLVGSTSGDQIGDRGFTPFSNGNYVVRSQVWDNGTAVDAGAVTWGDGTTGIVGVVSAANSLVGSTSGDNVGSGRITILSNGNYLVQSPGWGATDFGAVTWADGTTGISGVVSAANSLIGSSSNDQVGIGAGTVGGTGIELSSGNYVVRSPNWDNGALTNAGAVTWGNGATGISGIVSAANSIVGQTTNAGLGAVFEDPINHIFLVRFVTEGGGRVRVAGDPLLTFTYAAFADSTFIIHPNFLQQILSKGTALVLQASNDIVINSPIVVNNPGGTGGALTLQAGRSILLNANITTDDGNLTLIANDLLANGVVDSQRDPGDAVINMAVGTSINAGAGAVVVELRSGAGKTHSGSGAIDLQTVTAGSLTVEGEASITGPFVNAARLTVSDTTDLTLSDDYTQQGDFAITQAAGTLNVTGSAEVNIDGGFLLGSGVVNGDVTVAAGAYLLPGDFGVGILTTGNVTLTLGAQFLIPAKGATTPGSDYSQLVSSGTVDLGGCTLNVALLYTPSVDDDPLTIIQATEVTGTFFQGSDIAINGYHFTITYTATSVVLTRTDPLQAAGIPPAGSESIQPLTSEPLAPIVHEAIDRWVATGIGAAQVQVLQALEVRIGSLAPGLLGAAGAGVIWVDATAAGFGWFVDQTPSDDSEFANQAPEGMDLLTVIMHEMGHELGLPDLDPATNPFDLMAESLAAGVRRAPSWMDWDTAFVLEP